LDLLAGGNTTVYPKKYAGHFSDPEKAELATIYNRFVPIWSAVRRSARKPFGF